MTGAVRNPYLLMWLEAPLQSWGYDSKFGRRESLGFPTKSGVLGLICCGRGAGGKETDWLQDWNGLDMSVEAYVPVSSLKNGQLDSPLLRDFQMVGSGYDLKDPWTSLLVPKTNKGKKAVGGGAKMTYRYYLQDMAFAVLLQIPDGCAAEVERALVRPVWDLYLGRKNCVPTEFIFQGIFETQGAAQEKAQELAVQKGRTFSFRVLQGLNDGEVMTLNDVPVQFGPNKKYKDRQVTIQKWE